MLTSYNWVLSLLYFTLHFLAYFHQVCVVITSTEIHRDNLNTKTALLLNFMIWLGFVGLWASQERNHATSSNSNLSKPLCSGKAISWLIALKSYLYQYISAITSKLVMYLHSTAEKRLWSANTELFNVRHAILWHIAIITYVLSRFGHVWSHWHIVTLNDSFI